MRRDRHTHRCTACDKDAPCGGRYERNFDGFPEAVCSDYHSYRHQPWVCEDCREYACESGQSEDCEPYKATETFTPKSGEPFKVCKACLAWEQADEALTPLDGPSLTKWLASGGWGK